MSIHLGNKFAPSCTHYSSQFTNDCHFLFFSYILTTRPGGDVWAYTITRSCNYHLLSITFPTCTELGMLNDNMPSSFRSGRVWSAKVSLSGRNLSSVLTPWLSFNSSSNQLYFQIWTDGENSTRKKEQSV